MRITYRTLLQLIARMNDEQMDSDLTVEMENADGTECFAADLRIVGNAHDSLDDGHPVIAFNTNYNSNDARRFDVDQIANEIGLRHV